MDYRVIGTDGREYGPVSLEQIRAWISAGRIHSGTLARPENSLDWRPLGSLPECAPFTGPVPASAGWPAPAAVRRTNSLAVWGLVCGILSLTLCSCCCVPLDLVGIVLSSVALVQISSNPDTQTGTAIAVAGLVLSALSLVLGFLLTGLWFATGGAQFRQEWEREFSSGSGPLGWLLTR